MVAVISCGGLSAQENHQGHDHNHDAELVSCREEAGDQLDGHLISIGFPQHFNERYNFSLDDFNRFNRVMVDFIQRKVVDEICEGGLSVEFASDRIFELIETYRDELLFEPVYEEGFIVIGKYYRIPIEEGQEDVVNNRSRAAGEPCQNADFETCNFTGWETICGRVNNNPFQIINQVACVPGGANSQHAIVNGGNDPVVGVPRVNPAGGNCSVRVGDGTGTGARAGALVQTFQVDAASTVFTYSYAAILQDPGHSAGEQPFVRVRLYDENGQSISCAEYEAYGGDGQPGWNTQGNVTYRDWTTVFSSLENYVGQNVTMEFSVGDCSQSGHYGYAYVDAYCHVMEIEARCEGQATILSAPDGAAAYLWNTGETTREISVTTAGHYTCNVTPVQGANCAVLVEADIVPFPVPQPTFTPDAATICEGQNIEFTDGTTIGTNGVISSYQWDFGDGIQTPHSTGGITGVNQTTGTYTLPEHNYPNPGNYNVTLTVYSEDGCYNSYTSPVLVNQLPTATIAGDVNVCVGDAEPQVTFTGADGVQPYTFTYTINNGAPQTVTSPSGSNTVTVNVPTTTDGTFVYDLVSVEGGDQASCGQNQQGTVTVNINTVPQATIASDVAVCQNAPNPVVTFEGSNGTSAYTFTYSINGGADQTISTQAGQNSVTLNAPSDVVGAFVYNLTNVLESSVSACSQQLNETITVDILPLPTATISGAVDLCQYEPDPQVVFEGQNATAPYTFYYTINGGTELTTVSDANGDGTVGAPTNVVGNYTYNLTRVVDDNGCSSDLADDIDIEIHPLPTASISGSVNVCLNDPEPEILFEGVNGIEPFTFTYAINGGADQTVQSSGGPDVTITVPTSQAGVYEYNLNYVSESSPLTCGQPLDQTVRIEVYDLPVVSAGNDITVCEGFTVVLTGSGAVSYQWDNNVVDGIPFVPTQSGTYTVIGTDHNGCQNTDDMYVNWVPTPQVSFVADTLDGCLPVHTNFTAQATGNIATCLWNLGDGSTSNSCDEVTHSYPNAGCYTVSYTVTTVEGCTNTATIPNYICAYPYPIADFTPTPNVLSTIKWESEMVNETSGASTYFWDFGDNSAHSSEFSPIHEFPTNEGGDYIVTLIAYSEHGCTDTTTRLVKVNEEILYYVPNAFTPDNDDFNEEFKPIFTQGFDPYSYTLLIFNRWGEVLFESNDARVGWNGTYGGRIAEDGVYIWKITYKVKGVDKRQVITGHVTLLR